MSSIVIMMIVLLSKKLVANHTQVGLHSQWLKPSLEETRRQAILAKGGLEPLDDASEASYSVPGTDAHAARPRSKVTDRDFGPQRKLSEPVDR